MSFFVKALLAVTLPGLFVAPVGLAQLRETVSGSTPAVPPGSIEDALYAMSSQAGVIFAGQVLAVRPQLDLAYGSGSGWVEIEFRIDQAVRGCVGQATYVLREWSGLWSSGNPRYTVGQRLLMLLHTPSASGLSSPVGGQDGAIPLTGAGASPRPEDKFTTAVDQAVDLRWIEARLLRATPTASSVTHMLHPGIATRLQPVDAGRQRAVLATTRAERALQETLRPVEGRAVSAGFESPITVPMSGIATQGITLRSVLAMLQGWRAEQSNAAH